MTKILISAGEASGDLHAGTVTQALKELEPGVEVFGMGGNALRAAGAEVLFDIKDHSVMGFWEVLCKLPDIFKLEASFRKVMLERKPDCLLTIDYPGFNMRLAKQAKKLGIPVVSFIAPSAWAWRRSRAKNVVKVVDMVKPHLDVAAAMDKAGKVPGKPLVLLVPGSRMMEIKRLLPVILQAAK